jgi:hypothetical protein
VEGALALLSLPPGKAYAVRGFPDTTAGFGAIINGLSGGYLTGAEAWISHMTIDLSIALETLRLDPEDGKAREALARLSEPVAAGGASEEVAKSLAAERAIHEEANCPSLCLVLLEAELALRREPGARADLLVQKARLEWGELWQFEPARDSLREVLQLIAEHEAATAMLKDLDAEETGWQEQAEALSEKAAAAGAGPEGAAIFAEEAELLLRHRNVIDEAEALLRRSPIRAIGAPIAPSNVCSRRRAATSSWPSTWRGGSPTRLFPRKRARPNWPPAVSPRRPGNPPWRRNTTGKP